MDFDLGLADNSWEEQQSGASETGIKLTSRYKPVASATIDFGLECTQASEVYTRYDIPVLRLVNMYQKVDGDYIRRLSFYSQLKQELTHNLRFVGGIRIERQRPYTLLDEFNIGALDTTIVPVIQSRRYKNDKLKYNPQAALILNTPGDNTLKLNYSEATNYPSFTQTRNLVVQPDSTTLESEHIASTELSYLCSVSKSIKTSISLYYYRMNNLIVRSTGFDANGNYYSRWTNNGKMEAMGSEVILQVNPNDASTVELGLSYQEVEDLTDGMPEVAVSPGYLGYCKLAYQVLKPVSVSFTANYVDKMYSIWDPSPQDSSDPNSPPRGRLGPEVSDYWNLGAAVVIKNIPNEGLQLTLRAVNLLDTDIYYPVNANQPWARNGTLGPERSYYASLAYTF